MSTFFLPQSVIDKIKIPTKKGKSLLTSVALGGAPVTFETIKGYSNDFRNKIVNIAEFLEQPNAPESIDLTDECVAIAIDGNSLNAVLQSGTFTNLIALLGIVDGHLTISLLGADPQNHLAISPLYKQEAIQGYETWPRRGLLGQTKEFKEVLDCM